MVALLRASGVADFDRRALAVVGLASIAANLLLFALPLYSLQIYDRVLTSRSVDTLWLLTLIVVLALLAGAAIDAIRSRLLMRIGNAYALRLGPRLLDASLAQSARTAEPSGQALRDMATVRGFVASPQGLAALFDAPLVPLFLLGVYLMHVGLGHAMLLGVVVLIALAVATEALTGPSLRAAGEASIRAQRRIDGVMQNAEAAEAMGMRAALRDYWHQAQGESMAQASRAGDRAAHLAALAKGVRMMLSLMISAAGAWYAIHDEITIGGMVASSIIAARGLAPLEVLIGAWKNFVAARVAAARIHIALEKFPRAESGMQLPSPAGDLAVERLVFAPPGTEIPTIKGVSFELPAGTWLGLIGPSAAGKSTLARLICGVWQPRSGHVRLDGGNVFSWNRADFGRHCGYLPQDVELFAGSVRDNIARFTTCEDEAVVQAAKAAGCHEMILRLPQGYDTKVGAGGTALSAGQRQRVGLARALFNAPKLIVLDEPNANLDAEGEQALIQAVTETRAGGATIVMISHRPALLAGCDRIAVLVDGQLQHFGPRDEILAKLQPAALRSVAEARRGNT
jgi:PrtD family type I secretion system ABC transporter